jgi:murein DD-endopeptidase MepM/ murein hydrolase activator NlpD
MALALIAGVLSTVGVAVALAAPADERGPAAGRSVRPSALAPTSGLSDDMRAFARRMRDRRARLEGVAPVRGAVDYGTQINRFGVARGGHTHGGQDVFAPAGTPLYAVHDGIALEAGSDGGRGNYLLMYAPARRQTYVYMHMQEPANVRQGQRVRAGQRVGRVGCTGSCQGAHLHFEVHRGRGARGAGVDPLPYLKRWRRG